MTIVIACDEKYYNKATEYGLFDSLKKNWKDRVCVLCIGFKSLTFSDDKFEYAFCGHISIESYRKDWPSNREGFVCAEGEDFTKYFNIDDDELVIHLDVDMVMQRPLDEMDLLNLNSIEEGEFGMTQSADPTPSLREELYRIKPVRSYEKVNELFCGKLGAMNLYCTGFIVARMKTYRELSKIYNERFNDIAFCFDHHAAGQWLFNYIIEKNFVVYKFRGYMSNATWYTDTDAYEENNKLMWRGQTVTFNHTKFNKMYEY